MIFSNRLYADRKFVLHQTPKAIKFMLYIRMYRKVNPETYTERSICLNLCGTKKICISFIAKKNISL